MQQHPYEWSSFKWLFIWLDMTANLHVLQTMIWCPTKWIKYCLNKSISGVLIPKSRAQSLLSRSASIFWQVCQHAQEPQCLRQRKAREEEGKRGGRGSDLSYGRRNAARYATQSLSSRTRRENTCGSLYCIHAEVRKHSRSITQRSHSVFATYSLRSLTHLHCPTYLDSATNPSNARTKQ